MEKIIARKFVTHDVPPLDTLSSSRVYRLREKINSGESLRREEKDWLSREIQESFLFGPTGIALSGYIFDFSDVLHGYVVKQYGTWNEYYAPDRTSLRRVLYGKVDKIVKFT